MTEGVTWVAIAGLGLSIISLGWQSVSAALGRRRILVGLSMHVNADASLGVIPGQKPRDSMEIEITVENLGKRTLTVSDVGLRGRGPQEIATVRGWRLNHYKVVGPKLPTELLPGVTKSWRMPDESTSGHPSAVEWQGWASRWRGDRSPREYHSRRRISREARR